LQLQESETKCWETRIEPCTSRLDEKRDKHEARTGEQEDGAASGMKNKETPSIVPVKRKEGRERDRYLGNQKLSISTPAYK